MTERENCNWVPGPWGGGTGRNPAAPAMGSAGEGGEDGLATHRSLVCELVGVKGTGEDA
jgi:hypothetical protein